MKEINLFLTFVPLIMLVLDQITNLLGAPIIIFLIPIIASNAAYISVRYFLKKLGTKDFKNV